MARIIGVDIPDYKHILISLQCIYGIGRSTAHKILMKLKINPTTKVKDLNENEMASLRKEIQSLNVEGSCRQEKALNIRRLIEIRSYRGMRHKSHLPCHGQQTKSNARTCKGPRKTVANKKKSVAKR